MKMVWLALLVVAAVASAAGWFALPACVDTDWQFPPDQMKILCEGEWEASLGWTGAGPPPRGFERLAFTITERIDRTVALEDPLHIYARGTVAWNGVSWPMTLHFGPLINCYCLYAPGHPFRGTADPNGFSFSVFALRAEPPAPSDCDELIADHDLLTIKDPASLGSLDGWYRYRRVER